MSVITSLTAQNTLGIQAINEIPASFVAKQIDSVLSDIGVDAIKTGMLLDSEIIDIIAKKIRQYRVKRLVIDPVMISKDGVSLLKNDAREAMIKRLIPLSTVVTPNLIEASLLTGIEVYSIEEMKKAARLIYRMGAKNVVIKGGHLKGDAIDLIYDGNKYDLIGGERIPSNNSHGTGCTFASAIATLLAKGETIYDAVRKAKSFVSLAIKFGLDIGKGIGPVNPYVYISREMERIHIIEELKKAIDILRNKRIGHLIPEVSSNFGYALSYAEGIEDVASFPGRIARLKDSIINFCDPEFGSSRHIASIILTVMRFDPEYRSAMNIRYSRENVLKLRKAGLTGGYFDRRLEPKRIKHKEGSSLEWGVEEVLKKMTNIPDFIYDRGDLGKEPMIRVIGRNPMEVTKKILCLIN